MCVSMSANCGGTATTIGTGPNLIMFELIIDTFPECPLSFATWMAFAIPQLIICLIIVWMWLQLYYLPLPWKVYVFVYTNADRHGYVSYLLSSDFYHQSIKAISIFIES